MIGRITGTLLAKTPPQILIDVGGIGYEVDVPMSTFFDLPDPGQAVTLLTHFAVREDGQYLYGFKTADERNVFRLLLKISGIGARTALAVLSGLSVPELARAVTLQEASRIVKIPGIGKKTAERLLLELRGKLDSAQGGTTSAFPSGTGARPASNRDDILHALLALGYNEREALAAMKGLEENINVSAGIRLALRQLSPA